MFKTNKNIFATIVLFSVTLASSCAAPNLSNSPILSKVVNENNNQVNNSESFAIKKARNPNAGPKVSASPSPVVSASPSPALSPSPPATVSPTPLPTASPAQSSTERIISFSGYDWSVRKTQLTEGPGPNYFSDSSDNAWVDELGQLHLKITNRNGVWYCSSIATLKTLGYGKYKFYTASRVDQLPDNVVLGLFTWDDAPDYNHREIDIEFAKWGYPTGTNTDYVVQTSAKVNNYTSSKTLLSGDYSTHTFDWSAAKIDFQSYYGHYSVVPDSSYIISSWSYTGKEIPVTGNEKVMINLWNNQGLAPPQETEVIIKKFEFIAAAN
jgi:hypothetical protein